MIITQESQDVRGTIHSILVDMLPIKTCFESFIECYKGGGGAQPSLPPVDFPI